MESFKLFESITRVNKIHLANAIEVFDFSFLFSLERQTEFRPFQCVFSVAPFYGHKNEQAKLCADPGKEKRKECFFRSHFTFE